MNSSSVPSRFKAFLGIRINDYYQFCQGASAAERWTWNDTRCERFMKQKNWTSESACVNILSVFANFRWVIFTAIIYYLITVNLVALGHDHEQVDVNSEHCSACFFNANHVGIELTPVDVTKLNTCISIHQPITVSFISTFLDKCVRSRAPPTVPVQTADLSHIYV